MPFTKKDYTNQTINGYRIIGRDYIKAKHVYWKCSCIQCGAILSLEMREIKKRTHPCKKENTLYIFNHSSDRRDRGVYYNEADGSYQVKINYNNSEYDIGSYENRKDAFNIAKLSYSFQKEENLVTWFSCYKEIYHDMKQYCLSKVDDSEVFLSDVVDIIWNTEMADEIIKKDDREEFMRSYMESLND